MQSYNPVVLGRGFLRLLLRLQLRSLSRGVPSSHLEKDERLINSRTHIYLFMKASRIVLRGVWFREKPLTNTLYGIVWETKYGPFTTLNIPNC